MRRPARLSSTSANATSTLWRYAATDSSSTASLRAMLALLRPPSMIGIDISAPSTHERLLHLNTSDSARRLAAARRRSTPAPGTSPTRATPMRALDATIARCAAVMSGRRSSSFDGSPAGIAGSCAASGSGLVCGRERRRRLAQQDRQRMLVLRALALQRRSLRRCAVASSVFARARSNSPMSPLSKRLWLTFTLCVRRSTVRSSVASSASVARRRK